MGFGDLKSAAGLRVLNDFLADRSYIEGYVPSQADIAVFEAIAAPPPADLFHALRWYNHIKSYEKQKASLPGVKKALGKYGPADVEDTTGAATDSKDDDDIDLFGSDDEEVDSFRERITSEAEDLVANFFPKKLLELDGFLKEPILNIHDLTQIHSDMNLPVPDPILLTNSHDGLDGPNMKKRKLEDREETFQGTKVFVMPNGMLKSNQQLVDIIEKVKPEIRLLIEKCNTVKMWVQLLIPRIEDGNNFGVSIQEETVAELRTVESEAASYLDQISRYYITRAKLVSKIAKYPHVEDYRRTVTEIDEKEYISLRLIISELRNQYVTLHDMILKNIEKIKRPRSSNAETLY